LEPSRDQLQQRRVEHEQHAGTEKVGRRLRLLTAPADKRRSARERDTPPPRVGRQLFVRGRVRGMRGPNRGGGLKCNVRNGQRSSDI
jgi:hypothetical protein